MSHYLVLTVVLFLSWLQRDQPFPFNAGCPFSGSVADFSNLPNDLFEQEFPGSWLSVECNFLNKAAGQRVQSVSLVDSATLRA